MDEKALKLFGDIVTANVRSTQWATDQVIDNEREEKIQLARDFVRFYDLVWDATEFVTSRKLMSTLRAFGLAYDDALRILGEAGNVSSS